MEHLLLVALHIEQGKQPELLGGVPSRELPLDPGAEKEPDTETGPDQARQEEDDCRAQAGECAEPPLQLEPQVLISPRSTVLCQLALPFLATIRLLSLYRKYHIFIF